MTLSLPHDREVSRVHARLSCSDGVWFVEDAGSRGGTYVTRGNQRFRVTRPERLRHGDRIHIGRTALTFRDGSDALLEASEGTIDLDDAMSLEITDAERRVLEELCAERRHGRAGWPSNRDLARSLYLSEDTVRSHLKSLYRKFGLSGVDDRQRRAHLIERAIAEGHVEQPP
jgi:pSer/pThr/pTyr-binding forkhead associated (FHA) protein